MIRALLLTLAAALSSCGPAASPRLADAAEAAELAMLRAEVEDLRRLITRGPLVLTHDGEGPAVTIHQRGNGTALVVIQEGDNHCAALIAQGNSAGLQVRQRDGQDAIECLGGDLRCEQVILVGDAPHVALAPNGTIQWADPNDPLEYYDAIKMGPEGLEFPQRQQDERK